MFKTIKLIKIYSLTLLVIVMYSCTEGFVELNTDGNNPSSESLVNMSPLVTQTQRQAFVENRENTWRGNMILSGRMSEQFSFGFAGTWFSGGQGLKYDNLGWNDAAWDLPMGRTAAPLNELIVLTSEGGKFQDDCTLAVMKIMKGFFYQRMTDQFGAVPYLEGGQGIIPKFEEQSEVYNLIMTDLADAITSLKTCSGSTIDAISEGDLVYQGDVDKWLAAGNTLRLRMALRSGEANGGNQSVIDTSLSEPFISSSDNNFRIAQDPSNADPVFNGYHGIWNTWGGPGNYWVIGDVLVESFKSNNDPRLFGFAEPIDGGTVGDFNDYVGGKVATKFSYSNAVPIATLSRQARKIWDDPNFSYVTMTYSEAELLQAEAKYLKGDIPGAQIHFENAIRANASDWDVSASDINSYITTETSAQLSGTATVAMQQIGLNRWYAAYTNGYEAWSVMRRFDLDIFPDKTFSLTNEWEDTTGGIDNKMGKRINYSQATRSQNPDAVEFAVSAQGPDAYSTALWWDVN